MEKKNGRLTRHVPDLGLVVDAAAQQPPAGRPVAVVVALLQVGHILELLLQGQVVEALAQRILAVDLGLGDAKVDHIKEALCADGLDQDLGQLGVALGRAIFGQVNAGDWDTF